MAELKIKIERIGARQSVVLEDTELFGVMIPKGFRSDGATSPVYFGSLLARSLWDYTRQLSTIFNYQWMVKMPSEESVLIKCFITI